MQEDSTLDTEMSATAATLDIPPCPAILGKILREAHADEPDYNRIGTLISADIALSATVLKTVNSSFYGLRFPATSIQQALQHLGLRTVTSLVTGIMLRRAFPTATSPGMQRFWAESNRQATIGSVIGRELGIDKDAAYTYGLFRLCGIPVLRMKHEQFEPIITSDALLRSAPLIVLEREQFGIDHGVVGHALARGWNLPAELAAAIGRADGNVVPAPDHPDSSGKEVRLAAMGFLIEALSSHLAGNPEALENDETSFAIDTLHLGAAAVKKLAERASAGLDAS
jgi:HD-like signal output (HDOD) protein